jgi:hypothetical protein
VCDGTVTGSIKARFAPRAAASLHAAWSAVRGPPTVKLSTSLTIAMESACRVKIGSRIRRRKPVMAARPESLGAAASMTAARRCARRRVVCTENLIRVDAVTESPKLVE